MGLTPRDVDEMTPWEFLACLDGHNMANGATEKMDVDEYRTIMRDVYGSDWRDEDED